MRKMKKVALKALEGIFMVLERVLGEIVCIETCPCGCSGIWPIDGMSDEEYWRILNDDDGDAS